MMYSAWSHSNDNKSFFSLIIPCRVYTEVQAVLVLYTCIKAIKKKLVLQDNPAICRT
jgi:hypothetical protein